MKKITVAEHLETMNGETPLPWLVELGLMLQEIEGIDSALAASLAYDLARKPKPARALHQLIQGWMSMGSVLNSPDLTPMQAHTIQKTIRRIGSALLDLSSPPDSFHSNALYAAEKEA